MLEGRIQLDRFVMVVMFTYAINGAAGDAADMLVALLVSEP